MNLRFADDIDLVAEDDGQLQELTDEVHSSSSSLDSKSMWRRQRQ